MLKEWILLTLLYLMAEIDYKKRIVPLQILIPGSIAGVCFCLFGKKTDWISIAGGLLVGACVLLLCAASGGRIGSGDGLVFCMTGLFLGYPDNLRLLVWSSFLAGGIAVALMLFQKCRRDDSIPFVPVILAGYVWILVLR